MTTDQRAAASAGDEAAEDAAGDAAAEDAAAGNAAAEDAAGNAAGNAAGAAAGAEAAEAAADGVQVVSTRAVFARERRSPPNAPLVVPGSLEPAVMSLEEAVARLGRAYRELQVDTVSPERLHDMRAWLATMHTLLTEFGASSVAVNAASALKMFNERRLGTFLDSLERSPGISGSGYADLLRQWRVSYSVAHRWVSLGRAPAAIFDSYLERHLAYLTEGYVAGDEDLSGAEIPPPSSTDLLRIARRVRSEGEDSASTESSASGERVVSAAQSGSVPLDWLPPTALREAAVTALESVDHVIGAEGLSNPDWSGSVLVIAPPGVTASFSDHLLHCYGGGEVTRAILVVPLVVSSSWWASYAGWPVCLLSRISVDGLPATEIAAFCVSDDELVWTRFREAFLSLGFVYQPAAYDYDLVSPDGPAGIAADADTDNELERDV